MNSILGIIDTVGIVLEIIVAIIVGGFPIIFLGLFIYGIFCIKKEGQDKQKMRKNYFEKKRYYPKIKKEDWQTRVCAEIYISAFFILVFAKKIEKKTGYINLIIDNISTIIDIVLGLTAIVITLIIAMEVIDKEYYLVFSIHDISKTKHYKVLLQMMMISCISVCLFGIWIKGIKSIKSISMVVGILTLSMFIALLSSCILLWRTLNIMFCNDRTELKFLKKLYLIFYNKWKWELNLKSVNYWNKKAVDINIGYLLNELKKICNKKKIKNIEHVEFEFTSDCATKDFYKLAQKKVVIIIFKMIFFVELFNYLVSQTSNILFNICFVIGILNLVAVVAILIIIYSNNEFVQLALIGLFIGEAGYCFTSKNKKTKYLFEESYTHRNILRRYIEITNSIVGFFYIWIELVYDEKLNKKNKKLILSEFKNMISELETCENTDQFTFFPVFVIGFFLFCRNISCNRIKKIYNKFIVEKEINVYLFQRMLYSQIRHLLRYVDESEYIKDDIDDMQQVIYKYFIWMKS